MIATLVVFMRSCEGVGWGGVSAGGNAGGRAGTMRGGRDVSLGRIIGNAEIRDRASRSAPQSRIAAALNFRVVAKPCAPQETARDALLIPS